jgi:hypothetical protein
MLNVRGRCSKTFLFADPWLMHAKSILYCKMLPVAEPEACILKHQPQQVDESAASSHGSATSCHHQCLVAGPRRPHVAGTSAFGVARRENRLASTPADGRCWPLVRQDCSLSCTRPPARLGKPGKGLARLGQCGRRVAQALYAPNFERDDDCWTTTMAHS